MSAPSNSPRVAVVTGAGRGIGRAVALELCRAGYELWAVVRRPEAIEPLRSTAAAIFPQAAVRPFIADLAETEDVQALCDELQAEEHVPQVLVNNAGIAVSAPLAKHSVGDLAQLLAVNTVAPFALCRALMPRMAERGVGRVINIASTAGLKGFRYTSGYCASKHALVGMTKSLALEFAAKGVTVNAVCPGWTDTDMVSRSAQIISKTTGRDEATARQTIAAMNPLGRLVTPEEVAKVCAFLASPEAAAITGATYTVDGGETS